MRSSKWIAAVVVVVGMIGTSSASAAELIGSDLVAPADGPGFAPPATTTQTTQPPTVTLPLSATTSGVIVEIRIKHAALGATSGTGGFSILSGTDPDFTARISPLLPNFTWDANTPAGIRSFVPRDANGDPVGVPVAVGERLAYRTVSGDHPSIQNTSAGARHFVLVDHTSGTLVYSDAGVTRELLIQTRIEPDGDGDGYGDETQDACPQNPATHKACPSANAKPTPSANAKPTCRGEQATIVGTSGDDVIQGTDGADVVVAFQGDDKVLGAGGDDLICGNRGEDLIRGQAGDDRLYGGHGADRLDGGAGTDLLVGGAQADHLIGGEGPDRLRGGSPDAPPSQAPDRCRGGGAEDKIQGCER